MPASHVTEIPFDSKGDPLRLNILLNSPLPCTYEITSHDRKGIYQGTIMKGNNLGGPEESFHIPTAVDELDQRIIGWHIIFAAPDDGVPADYAASLQFVQGQDIQLSDPVTKSGSHANEKIVIGFARLIAHGDIFQDAMPSGIKEAAE